MCVCARKGEVNTKLVFLNVYPSIVARTNCQVKHHKSGLFLCEPDKSKGLPRFLSRQLLTAVENIMSWGELVKRVC